MGKERGPGPRPGDRQPAHESGRSGTGTRPSGTGIRSGSTSITGKKSGTIYRGPGAGIKKK